MRKQKYSRRSFLQGVGLLLVSLPCAGYATNPSLAGSEGKGFMVYAGTYARESGNNLYAFYVNIATGALEHCFSIKGFPNASFLALDSQNHFLYAVNETDEFKGGDSGAVSAFAIDPETGKLTFLNRRLSHGGLPCYISLDRANGVVLVANYIGGNVVVFPIQPNGALGIATDVVQNGSQLLDKNEVSPHAHCFLPDPENNYFLAVDLGLDKILKYRLEGGRLISDEEPAFSAESGSGARLLTFHPDKHHAYLICERSSSIYSLFYDPVRGTFQELQKISTLPKDYTGKNACAHVQVSNDGKFLYGSNRGHNSIVVYAIDSNGKLTFVQHADTQGDIPKNFVIEPTGNILMVANQKSNNIISFRIHKETGKISSTGHQIKVPSPIYLQVLPL